jgi:exodeoxyribonuclease-3
MTNVFKIATWNVNSLRVRLPQVLSWVQQHQPDVLALQETKLTDDQFPLQIIQDIGYTALYAGQKAYNGVALFIKQKNHQDVLLDIPTLQDPQRRVLGALIEDIYVLNLYVPNGETITSEKYQYKLHWLQHVRDYLQAVLLKHSRVIVLGDFNIAPAAIDVHDPQRWEGQVLCSEREREAFNDLLKLGLKDCFRHLYPTEQQFSWWDYRMHAFKRNIGLRIDHVLVSEALVSFCKSCHIDKVTRMQERPSDHAPVFVSFEF